MNPEQDLLIFKQIQFLSLFLLELNDPLRDYEVFINR